MCIRDSYIISRLGFLIMVYQDHLFFPVADQVPPGDGADIFSPPVNDRIIPVTAAPHDFLDILQLVAGVEGDQVVLRHQILNRYRLINQPGNGIGVMGLSLIHI